MRGLIPRLAAVALLAAALALPGEAPASFPGHAGQIAFSSFRYAPHALKIEAIKPSGKGRKALLKTSSASSLPGGPDYSPNGSTIAFEAEGALQVARANGTALRTVISGIAPEPVAFGPDGRHLVFSMSVAGNFDIFSIRTDGTELTRLTDSPGRDRQPAWAADDRHIAWVSTRSGSPHVWLMRPDGSGRHLLVPDRPGGGDSQVQPDFAPSGKRIAVVKGARIVTMRLDGSHRRTLGERGTILIEPAYSPDGRHVAAITTSHKRNDIAILGAAGRGARTLGLDVPAKSPSGIFGLAWQPRGAG
jgi:Tol biopolymer transport system component